MKTIINAIRDFIYNITDYGLIIVVIVVMVLILGWRFDILFNRGIEKDKLSDLPQIIAEEEYNNSKNPQTPDDPDDAENPEKPEGETPDTPAPSGLIATVEIPEGSFPSSIAKILQSSNLISDTNEFLNRSVELGLDTKLRSGTYEIEVGTSLDDIIKIIANAY
ncbi:endolytic transglycosylase MltG [Sedimentibacter saalensis]|jgi:hypothetical protein|uniref:YceG-like family protein n=1 Tax=Sedimentibacter saalensis TaxID=130788 RepID=A0A562J9C6_9FIRM|nr:endolytic transglycosylase MltG [Sedimentibacter saalensis]MEA5095719.1 endolytic transglycosylase MltG [Sedimentibacter saalensis]TWH79776.1 hypothetical protein LY60_02095 [Sedimentibacter saalensis]